jgi:hypothetical protein
MTDKLKTGGEAIKGALRAGSGVVDKALDKSSDVLTLMINNATRLISKLSDDIGIMADRILTMEERIGLMADRIGVMADRIVHTEELMARLTATLAAKDLDAAKGEQLGAATPQPPVLAIPVKRVDEGSIPELGVSGAPAGYLLYVSSSPLFRDGETVVTRVRDAGDLPACWRRSVAVLKGAAGDGAKRAGEPMVVSVAVKAVGGDQSVSPFSNSVDVTLLG